MRFLVRWILTSIAVAAATFLVPGLELFGTVPAWVCLAGTGLFLCAVDSLVKPLVSLISLPFTCLTLGLFQLVVNGLMLELAAWLSVNLLGAGVVVNGAGAAIGGAVIVSIVSAILEATAQDR